MMDLQDAYTPPSLYTHFTPTPAPIENDSSRPILPNLVTEIEAILLGPPENTRECGAPEKRRTIMLESRHCQRLFAGLALISKKLEGRLSVSE
jgi:hypothetical protein